MNIREMKAEDIEQVRQLDALAFSAYRKNIRKSQDVLFSLISNPKGCFVVEEEKIVGYIFSHIWGKLAWIGTFGIDPKYQGRGIGKRLFETVLKYLNNQGCLIIGLETMADSAYNIGMYLKLGFHLIYPTLFFKKSFNSAPTIFEFNEAVNIEKVSELSRTVLKELDYTSEVENAIKNNWGKVIFFGEDNPYGFAILRFSSVFEGQPDYIATVNTLIINSNSEEKFLEALGRIEALTILNNRNELVLPVNCINPHIVQSLLQRGYQLQRNIVRLTYKGEYQNLKGIDLSRWGM
jgi:GNAT superfamily N-acetyltransferase